MKDYARKGILATQCLERSDDGFYGLLHEQVAETKPSRVNRDKSFAEKHEKQYGRRSGRRYDDDLDD